jgi:hypothetical protein
VRQLFAAGCIHSAYWHRFAATAHSPIGLHPEAYGITLKPPASITFAHNDLPFDDPVGTDHDFLGAGLRKALYNYMHGVGLDVDVREWFDGKTPRTRVGRHYIEKALQQADQSDAGGHSGGEVHGGAIPQRQRAVAALARANGLFARRLALCSPALFQCARRRSLEQFLKAPFGVAGRRARCCMTQPAAHCPQSLDQRIDIVGLCCEKLPVDIRCAVGREHGANVVERQAGGLPERDQRQLVDHCRHKTAARPLT